MPGQIKIHPYSRDFLLGKRFPIPVIEVECPKCRRDLCLDDMTTDYPAAGRAVDLFAMCPYCDTEFTIPVVIRIDVEAAG